MNKEEVMLNKEQIEKHLQTLAVKKQSLKAAKFVTQKTAYILNSIIAKN